MEVNIINLRREMENGMNRSLSAQAHKIIEKEFLQAKKSLIRSFEKSPPSLALSNQVEDRLEEDQFVEKGNLYTFMGFEDGRDPVEEVSDILQEAEIEHLSLGSINRNGVYVITGKVVVPTLAYINEQSQLDWITRGWVDSLTHGLRGLPNFLFGDFSEYEKSRSQGGLEAKTKKGKGGQGGHLIDTGRGEFKPFKGEYLFEFLQAFKAKLKG
jgi:hypothetical protein